MEGGIDADVPLDYAAFQIFPTQNRYEACACHDREIEKVASGVLEHLMLELPEVKNCHPEEDGDGFKLQLPKNLRGSEWFTKSTLARFLDIVSSPELLNNCKTIRNEMSQLEEARKFHLQLYAQGPREHPGTGETDGSDSIGADRALKTASSDSTKNELLRAIDLRITALNEDFSSSFSQAVGVTCSTDQINDLLTFCEHFGTTDLRNSLSRYLALGHKNQVTNIRSECSKVSLDSKNDNGNITHESPVKTFKAIKYAASPAKAAQVERQSSTGSDESSNSSDEEKSFSERSRPLMRPTSSRRSASPMRRIQIGRSGSRRAAALTIKSLNFVPARERIAYNRDGNSSEGEDGDSVQPPKKPESNVRRMSVQDAISLFENKQRDQSSDLQKKKSSAEVSVNTSKAVLRRWSAGMGDSSTQCASENSSECAVQTTIDNSVIEEMKSEPVSEDMEINSMEVEQDRDYIGDSISPKKTAERGTMLAKRGRRKADILVVHGDEPYERVTNSAIWSRQKEAELSQMLKMMENKPVRNRKMTTESRRSQEVPIEQRGGFYDHYKQKRDAKLRGENSGKRAEKEEQFKALKNILDQQKAELATKVTSTAGKQNALSKPRKSQKNLSPPVQPKKETPKPTVSRKASPKASPKPSPLPATRKSLPLAPSPRTTAPTPTRTPNGVSSGTPPTRRKSQPTPSPTRTNPKAERPQMQQKTTKATPVETKRSLKSQEVKKQPVTTRSEKISKTKKSVPAPVDDSSVIPNKPSFYSKVTRKGSVVPIESKPFLRKGTGLGPGVAKTKTDQSDEPLRKTENFRKDQEDVVADTPKPATQEKEEVVLPLSDVVTDLELEASVDTQQFCEQTENHDQYIQTENHNQYVAESDCCEKTPEFPLEIQSDEVSTISPNAWVEIEEHQEMPASCENDVIKPQQVLNVTTVAPITLSSPRVRHSLSQMLQEENGEPEVIEWGNAENPPSMVYQKDAPKGLKRLLKFTRKNKGEANTTGWSSPSVFSEGEEDTEESKASSKRNSDALLRKVALQSKGYGQPASLGDSYNGGNLDQRPPESTTTIHDLLTAAQLNRGAPSSHKLQEGHISAATTSTKAARSFFSLSTFRSSKSNETKLR